MARVDNALEYYVANYSGKEVSRYDSHKKSDLRKVYNKIVKTNKDSPLYKLSNADEAKKFAIDIKETAKQIQNVVAELSDDDEGTLTSAFQKKVAVSSDEDLVSVKYVGDDSSDTQSDKFEIEIERLASPQVNTGHYIRNDAVSLMPGNYSIDLNTNTASYELQFSVNLGENNRDILDKLSRLVNNSNLGLDADVLDGGDGTSALQFTSHQTGLSDDEEYLFSVSPQVSASSIAAMDVLGINNVSSPAVNSSFKLNGSNHSSLSNTFTINNAFELTLKKPSEEGTSTTIGFKANSEAVADNIKSLVSTYNNILVLADRYSGSVASAGQKLFNEMSSVSRTRMRDLYDIGLQVDSDSSITIDDEALSIALEPNRIDSTLNTLQEFKNAIGEKADAAAIDPMHYVNKVVVAYKNPGHNFNTPYISSIYSGLMLDSYL